MLSKRGYEAWFGFDLDGTLAKHESGDSVDHIGEPIPPMIALAKQKLAAGYKCKIMTARVCSMASYDEQQKQRQMIQTWCMKHIGQILEVVCEKDYAMVALYDDRAIGVERNTGRIL